MFFGWYVVTGTFVAQLLIVGFFTYSVSLLVGPVRAEFDVSLEQVMYSMTAGTFFGLAAAPICGGLLDRYPVRWLMASGIIVFAAGLWWVANATSIAEYVLVFGLTLAVSNGLAGSMASSTTVSRWFSASRGKALGIAAIGTSAGGILIPGLMTHWIDTDGWRSALENLSLLTLLVALPLVVLTIRGRPEDIGLHAEGEAATTSDAAATDHGMTIKQILSSRAYWFIGLSLGLLFCVYSSVISNLAPYTSGLGHSNADSSALIMILAVASLVGKIAFGLLADKIDLKLGLWAAIALVAAALLILSTEPGYLWIALAAVLMGLATGGMLPVWGSMMAHAFGLVSYGKAMGLMGPLLTLLVMPGYTIVGRLYDMTGNYQMAMTVLTGLALLSAAALTPLQLEER
jgi:MFS family permease